MEHIENAGEDIVRLKKAVRKKVLALRDGIPAADKAEYDAGIRGIVTGMDEYREAEVILTYVSYKSEVDTILLIEQALADSKAVFAPKVAEREMEFWKIASLNDLQEGYHGILEPVQSISFLNWICGRCSIVNTDAAIPRTEDCMQEVCKVMMWMPGAVFDKEHHRIGYGGGFYDRYLNRLSGNMDNAVRTRNSVGQISLITAALAYSCQILEQIPHERHDMKPNLLITEQGICC